MMKNTHIFFSLLCVYFWWYLFLFLSSWETSSNSPTSWLNCQSHGICAFVSWYVSSLVLSTALMEKAQRCFFNWTVKLTEKTRPCFVTLGHKYFKSLWEKNCELFRHNNVRHQLSLRLDSSRYTLVIKKGRHIDNQEPRCILPHPVAMSTKSHKLVSLHWMLCWWVMKIQLLGKR